MDRNQPMKERDEFGIITTMVLSIPRLAHKVDALAVMPGMLEGKRVSDVIREWQRQDNQARFLLIAGQTTDEEARMDLSMKHLADPSFSLVRCEGVHYTPHAKHTKDQAEWIVGRVKALGIKSLALFTASYHMPRAYCTLIKAFSRVAAIPVIPVPVAIPPGIPIPKRPDLNGCTIIPGEISRMEAYQATNDVATLEEVRQYLDWLWKVPPLNALR